MIMPGMPGGQFAAEMERIRPGIRSWQATHHSEIDKERLIALHSEAFTPEALAEKVCERCLPDTAGLLTAVPP
jgi:hypothetical protein